MTNELETKVANERGDYLRLQVEVGMLTEALTAHQRQALKREAELLRMLASNYEKRAEILQQYEEKETVEEENEKNRT